MLDWNPRSSDIARRIPYSLSSVKPRINLDGCTKLSSVAIDEFRLIVKVGKSTFSGTLLSSLNMSQHKLSLIIKIVVASSPYSLT